MPTTVVVASEIPEEADYVQSVMSSSTLRIYINDDVVGCEMGGALKNIIALCAGICDGMGYGDNTKAWVILSLPAPVCTAATGVQAYLSARAQIPPRL